MADTTDFSARCEILADVWMEYRDDEGFKDLMEFADLGFPLAYAVANGMVESTEIIDGFVNDTYDLLLKTLGVADEGFQNINELFSRAEEKDS
jgi:hypothetical protein